MGTTATIWSSRWRARWARLGRPDACFIARAIVILALIRVALWLCSFRQVVKLTDRFSPPSFPGVEAATPDRCARWIPVAARLVPRASCLTQALATRWLLRSIGAECELQVGVAKRLGTFSAHAVLVHQGEVIVGGKPLEYAYRRIFSC